MLRLDIHRYPSQQRIGSEAENMTSMIYTPAVTQRCQSSKGVAYYTNHQDMGVFDI